ncbi:MAG: S-adenosylmethionine decarboxylase family protein [Hyphomicrobium sp.]
MWGKHLIIDMGGGDPVRVRSGEHIRQFSETLVQAIGMKAYGPPLLKHFAEHVPEAAGYSLVQLIETSAITGHFCDASGDAYIDIFSCRDFETADAMAIVEECFNPSTLSATVLVRQARRPGSLSRACRIGLGKEPLAADADSPARFALLYPADALQQGA